MEVYPQYSPLPYVDIKLDKERRTSLYTTRGQHTILGARWNKLHTGGCRNVSLLYTCARQYHTDRIKRHQNATSSPNQKSKKKVQQLLDYANTYKMYYASNIQLHVVNDAVFLVLPKAQSHTAGYFRLLNHPESNNFFYKDNGPILIECLTLRSIVTSVTESETNGVFHNAKKVLPIIYTLEQMVHPQKQPVPIRTNNSTSAGFISRNIQMKQSKTWDMQLNWLCDK